MTTEELAEELGVPKRTLYRYMKRPDWPQDGDLEAMRAVVNVLRGGTRRGRGSDRVKGGASTSPLAQQKLEEEIRKLRIQNGEETERIIAAHREEVRDEVRRFLGNFRDRFHAWAAKHKLKTPARDELNRVVDAALADLAQQDPPP